MRAILPILLLAAIPATTIAAPAELATQKRKPDLADVAAGTYEGAVVADVRGSSGTQVVVTVKRVAKNVIELSCDYARVPTVRLPLIRAMDAILNNGGHDNFLIEQGKDPKRLDLSIDGRHHDRAAGMMRARCSAVASGALLLLGSSAAIGQHRIVSSHDMHKALTSAQAARLAGRLRLATYPDGGYIATINGRHMLPILRNGMRLAIEGRGFAVRMPHSTVALFDGDKTAGATLVIIAWSDTRVVADIAATQNVLTANTAQARLLLQGIRDGFMTRYELKNLRFVAGS